MVNEEDAIRKFVARQLVQCSDLSSLTLGVLRKRYLEHAGRESLSIKDRQLMKTIVEEELLKMQESSDDEPLVKFVDKKRKRVDDGDEGLTNEEMERTKRSRHEVSSPDSPDSGIVKAMNEEGQKEVEDESDHDKNADDDSEEDKKNTGKKVKQQKKNTRGNKESKKREMQKKQAKIIDSEEEEELEYSDEEKLKTAPAKGKEKREDSGSEEKTHDKQTKNSSSESASDSEDTKRRSKGKIQKKRKEMKKKTPVEMDSVKEVERQVFGSSSESEEEKTEMTKTGKSSDPESERTGESEEECVANSSIRKKEKETLQEHLGEVEEDSDSSSLPSLEDEEEQEKGKKEGKQKSVTKKKRSEERENTARAKDEENKTVARLKRYISLCGVRRNYKKLLDGCRSVKAKVAVLKKELEELGVEGKPSIEKCKKARLKREEAQEVAELDVSNIITTQGRPKRKAAAAVWPPPSNVSPPRFVYKHAVDSDSDSEDSRTNRGRKRATAWSNLQGIISDDGESD